jgi:hypothetical protein
MAQIEGDSEKGAANASTGGLNALGTAAAARRHTP